MAKKSKIARNEQRKVIVARYATKRLELKKALVDPAGTDESPANCPELPSQAGRFLAVPRFLTRIIHQSSTYNCIRSEEDIPWLTSH